MTMRFLADVSKVVFNDSIKQNQKLGSSVNKAESQSSRITIKQNQKLESSVNEHISPMFYILNSYLFNDIDDIVNTSTDFHLIVHYIKV